MPGNKTHEHQLRQIQEGQESQDWREGAEHPQATKSAASLDDPRQTGNPNSSQGMNQESRDHNKHNNSGQSGHKPQKHSPNEEKQ